MNLDQQPRAHQAAHPTSDLTMTIDGKAATAQRSFGVINPATGDVFAQAPDASQADLDAAMSAAQRAFRTFRKDESSRRDLLRACAGAVREHADALAALLVQEQGKPAGQAAWEVGGTAMWFDYTAGLPIPVEVVHEDDTSRVEIHRKPIGVVGAITPWNFPLILAVWKVAPALLAGNTIVLKPSPFTPLTSLKLGEILRDVLPAGVFNVVSGGDELGKWITEHPAVRKISFTGSVETGKKIAAVAAPDLKRLTLELGGNDAAIVLKDVNPKTVAEKLFWGAFTNSGQVCSAIKRLYVDEAIYQPIVDELAAIAKSTKVGDGKDPETQIGPVNNEPQLEKVQRLVQDAKQAGARIAAGGERLGRPGYFYPPTLITGVAEGTRIVDEEQFGPVLPIMPYRSVDEAIERANATTYGLSGSVWTSDLERGKAIAAELECGTSWVNQHLAIVPFAPFGGAKWSGMGVENGPWGLLGFTEIQVINIAKS